jgi:hypothetical protein
MSALQFEWDSRKAAENQKKHGVSFEEARTAFFDESARLIDDPDHSGEEERFILLGLSSTLRLLVVCHCYRSEGNVIRIISARKATARESKAYPQQVEHAQGIRLFQVSQEPVRHTAEEANHDSARRRRDRVLQRHFGRGGHSLPEPHQPLFARLRGLASKAQLALEVATSAKKPITYR